MTSSLLAALGLVGIVFGLLHFGLALFGAGYSPLWVGANLVTGFVLLAAAAAMNLDGLRERMRSGEARRAGRYGTSAILSTALLIAILGAAAFLSTRYHRRYDWSEAKVHSLSEQSRKVLDALSQDVEVVALYAPLDVKPVRDLLDRYAFESPRFKVSYVDPNERPELLAQYKLDPEKLGHGLVHIALGGEALEVSEPTEENVTNAMVKLTRTGEKKVYFVEGHGEGAIEGEPGAGKHGFERAADALRNENYQVEKLLLAAKGEVPADADVVIVPGPTRPLLDVERAALRAYLGRGGALMVMIDPRAQTDLVDDVRAWGVKLGDDLIIDRQLAMFGRPTTPIAGSYDQSHPITKDLHDATIFETARSVRAGDDAKGAFTELVFTGEASWAETDLAAMNAGEQAEVRLDDRDLPGPVSIAVAGTPRVDGAAEPGKQEAGKAEGEGAGSDAKPKPKQPRLVVFGDSDFASNAMIEAYRNRDLFVNAANWLIGDVEAIAIRPARSRASRFELSAEQFLTIRALSLLVLPEAIAIAGVLAWWSRRRAPGSAA